MSMKKFCKQLMQFKEHGIKFNSYMGSRWFVSKVIIAIAALLMIFQQNEASRIFGFVLLGYLIGVVSVNIRSYIFAKGRWELQREVIDWKKVEECLEANE